MTPCLICGGRCRLGTPLSRTDIIDDLQLCQDRWHKARREGKSFRAEGWAQMRDLALDHLIADTSA